MRIVTGCLRPKPTDCLPILAGIQPAELRRQGATFSLAYRSVMDPKHLLLQIMVQPTIANKDYDLDTCTMDELQMRQEVL